MKKYIKKVIAMSALLIMCSSCDTNDNELLVTTLKKVDFPLAVQTSSSELVLSSSKAAETVVTISWPEVKFPIKAPVMYTLLFDIASDKWVNPLTVLAGTDVLSKSFEGSGLNAIAKRVGLKPGIKGTLQVKIQAYMDRNVYSGVLDLPITPY